MCAYIYIMCTRISFQSSNCIEGYALDRIMGKYTGKVFRISGISSHTILELNALPALGNPTCNLDLTHLSKQVPACTTAGSSSQEWSIWVATDLATQFCLLKKFFLFCIWYRYTYRWTCSSSTYIRIVELNAFLFYKKHSVLTICKTWARFRERGRYPPSSLRTYNILGKTNISTYYQIIILSAWLMSIVDYIYVITLFWSGKQ